MMEKEHDAVCSCCGNAGVQTLCALKNSHLYRCQSCSFCFVHPTADRNVFYQKLERWAEEDVVDELRRRIAFDPATLALYRKYLDRLVRLNHGRGRLVDIGCSTGAFLSVARERGWDVAGVEAGKASSKYARDVLGLPVKTGPLEQFNWEQQFDAVVLTDVIEHLPVPIEALLKINSMLKLEGIVVLTTPNFDSLYRRLFGTEWWVINCEEEHLSLFNPLAIRQLLERCGFCIVRLSIRSIDIAGIASRLFRKKFETRPAAIPAEDGSYYSTRARKEKIKNTLGQFGLLTVTRTGMRILETLFSLPFSPLYGWGEQLVVFARKTGPGSIPRYRHL